MQLIIIKIMAMKKTKTEAMQANIKEKIYSAKITKSEMIAIANAVIMKANITIAITLAAI